PPRPAEDGLADHADAAAVPRPRLRRPTSRRRPGGPPTHLPPGDATRRTSSPHRCRGRTSAARPARRTNALVRPPWPSVRLRHAHPTGSRSPRHPQTHGLTDAWTRTTPADFRLLINDYCDDIRIYRFHTHSMAGVGLTTVVPTADLKGWRWQQ